MLAQRAQRESKLLEWKHHLLVQGKWRSVVVDFERRQLHVGQLIKGAVRILSTSGYNARPPGEQVVDQTWRYVLRNVDYLPRTTCSMIVVFCTVLC